MSKVTLKRRSAAVKKRKDIFKRAEQYVKEYRIRERDEIRLARQVRTLIHIITHVFPLGRGGR